MVTTCRAAVEAALRVLCAVNSRQNPSSLDVDALVKYAGPQPAEMDLDEFACYVVQEARQAMQQGRRRA